jgi:hypothetical protein
MLLLAKERQRYRLLLVEVKVSSNDPWFAAVENLRQMRLFNESVETQSLFQVRHPELDLGGHLQTTAVVLAPSAFYSVPHKKAASVAPARKLVERMRTEAGVDIQLATWEPQERAIEPLGTSRNDFGGSRRQLCVQRTGKSLSDERLRAS